MAQKTVYLAGAMEAYAGTDLAFQWRKEAKDWFKEYGNAKIISPVDYYAYGENYHKNENEVMRFDLHKVKSSDIVLANLANIRKSVGTCDEIMYAWMNNIPVVGFLRSDDILTEKELIEIIHPWKYLQINRIETGDDALLCAMEYIQDYYCS